MNLTPAYGPVCHLRQLALKIEDPLVNMLRLIPHTNSQGVYAYIYMYCSDSERWCSCNLESYC